MGAECVVADAVAIEPVSAPNSLLTGKLTGNYLPDPSRGVRLALAGAPNLLFY